MPAYEDDRLSRADLYPEEHLAAAVLRVGLKLDGPDYVTTPCGVIWCETAGLEPELLYTKAAQAQGHHGDVSYEETPECRHFRLGQKVRVCRHGVRLRGYATASQL